MAVRQDIEVTERGALVIKDGDFVIVESDPQHIDLALKSSKGMWKQWPTFGANINEELNSTDSLNAARRKIINTLESDEYRDISVRLVGGSVYVNAKFKGNDN